MATQKGLVVEKAGAPFTVVDNIPRSKPGPKQALVKSLFVAINPVYAPPPLLSNIIDRDSCSSTGRSLCSRRPS